MLYFKCDLQGQCCNKVVTIQHKNGPFLSTLTGHTALNS
jgi:hypothetical protein